MLFQHRIRDLQTRILKTKVTKERTTEKYDKLKKCNSYLTYENVKMTHLKGGQNFILAILQRAMR